MMEEVAFKYSSESMLQTYHLILRRWFGLEMGSQGAEYLSEFKDLTAYQAKRV